MTAPPPVLDGPACVWKSPVAWFTFASSDLPLPLLICPLITISTTHRDLHRCAHVYTQEHGKHMHTCKHIQIHVCTHRYKQIHMCPPTDTHPQLQGRWPGLASAGGAGLAPPSALGGLQRGWEFQGHPGRAGREFTSAPAAQAFVSLSVVSWVALVPGVSAHLRGGWHAAVRARRAAGAGGFPT